MRQEQRKTFSYLYIYIIFNPATFFCVCRLALFLSHFILPSSPRASKRSGTKPIIVDFPRLNNLITRVRPCSIKKVLVCCYFSFAASSNNLIFHCLYVPIISGMNHGTTGLDNFFWGSERKVRK